MAKPKRRHRVAPSSADQAGPDLPARGPADGWVWAAAVALIAVTSVNAWNNRYVLNPDGVSYLDLAERLSAGDWGAFVQGYWSPVYPALLALVSAVGGHAPTALLTAAHALNALAVVGTIVLLWWWGRRSGGSLFTLAAFAALFLVSSGFPRIEAVTPDSLLLALIAWLGYELLVRQGTRWWSTGLLFGAIFLVKTSAWPWFLASIPLRLVGARGAGARAAVWRSIPVTVAVMLFWVVPMSVKAGHPTLGSAGRLNYCWYIDACDSRSPDTHQGRHVAYRDLALDSTRSITWAEFDAERWTYAPWSDPTAWDAGILTRRSSAPVAGELVSYWGRQAGRTFALWLLPMLAGVLLPWALFEWRAERRRWWIDEGRPVLAVLLLGLAGIVQFILIHAEPRLLAPYGMLLALAVLHRGSDLPRERVARGAAVGIGTLLVAWFGYGKVREGIDTGRQLDQIVATMAATNAEMAGDGISQRRLVILGPAFPVVSGAYLSGSRIIAQVPPASAAVLDRLPVEQRRAVLRELFGGRAQVAWRSDAEKSATFVMIPAR